MRTLTVVEGGGGEGGKGGVGWGQTTFVCSGIREAHLCNILFAALK